MNLGSLADRAKRLVSRRGGTESLKEDAEELRDIAHGEGSISDKAKEAAEALKEPGKKEEQEPSHPPAPAGEPQRPAEPERRDEPGPGPGPGPA
jgi:hypothetical protein